MREVFISTSGVATSCQLRRRVCLAVYVRCWRKSEGGFGGVNRSLCERGERGVRKTRCRWPPGAGDRLINWSPAERTEERCVIVKVKIRSNAAPSRTLSPSPPCPSSRLPSLQIRSRLMKRNQSRQKERLVRLRLFSAGHCLSICFISFSSQSHEVGSGAQTLKMCSTASRPHVLAPLHANPGCAIPRDVPVALGSLML